MHILIPNLHEYRPTLRQQIPRHRQPVPQIRQIRMNPITPRIPESLYLLRLSRYMIDVSVLHVPACCAPLEIRIELYSIRRVKIKALHLAAQTFPLG